jgi:hypothetical protein
MSRAYNSADPSTPHPRPRTYKIISCYYDRRFPTPSSFESWDTSIIDVLKCRHLFLLWRRLVPGLCGAGPPPEGADPPRLQGSLAGVPHLRKHLGILCWQEGLKGPCHEFIIA